MGQHDCYRPLCIRSEVRISVKEMLCDTSDFFRGVIDSFVIFERLFRLFLDKMVDICLHNVREKRQGSSSEYSPWGVCFAQTCTIVAQPLHCLLQPSS